MLTYVLGAPGAGKTTLVPLLQERLPTRVVIDWDAFMDIAGKLAGRDIRSSPETWPDYGGLVRAIVEAITSSPIVLLGVCTPAELHDWSVDAWVLLDCSDDEREKRLADRDRREVEDAIADGRRYRQLRLPIIDTTGYSPTTVATELADLIEADAAP